MREQHAHGTSAVRPAHFDARQYVVGVGEHRAGAFDALGIAANVVALGLGETARAAIPLVIGEDLQDDLIAHREAVLES